MNRVAITEIEYHGWRGALRLTNGTIDAVVVPAIGRVMRYGFVGGPNLLWENPTVAGKSATNPAEWTNWGGDKIWPWPQDDWGKRMPGAWPPPLAIDQRPHQVEIIAHNALRMTSAPAVGFGIRAVRDIRLEPTGTRLWLTNALVKLRDGETLPLGAWTVTQIPDAAAVWARLDPKTTLASGFKVMHAEPRAERIGGGLLRFTPEPDKAAKIGCDADVLATIQGDTLLAVKYLPGSDSAAGGYVAGDRAQFWHNPPDPRYIEMEFTGPTKVLKNGEMATMVTRFEAIRRRGALLREADLPDLLRQTDR